MKPTLLVHGMHGLGDNIHQRAVLRLLMETYSITLETSWASIYHDLIAQGLKVVRRPTALRTQARNANRPTEAAMFSPAPPAHHHHHSRIRIGYNTRDVIRTRTQTVLEAMLISANLAARVEEADYRLPLKQEWLDAADALIASWKPTKPILIYRPLTHRPEWPGASIRAANPECYAEIVAMFRDEFFVVSVGDLEPGKEWVLGPQLRADVTLHKGELEFETLAALYHRAKLVYTAGGFSAILGPAVGTAVMSIGGGYEPPSWMSSGARFAPFLSVPTMHPCVCGSSSCRNHCEKLIDMVKARDLVQSFLARNFSIALPATHRPRAEMFSPAEHDAPKVSHMGRMTLVNNRQGARA